MKIGIDMMGGDFAPLEAVKGVESYLAESVDPAKLFLFGDEAVLAPLLKQHNLPANTYEITHATQVIEMHEHPARALKEKKDSSIAKGFASLSSATIDAFISAGNSGAMLVGAMYQLNVFENLTRPAISTILPKLNGSVGLLLDVGLNADCKPEQLNQFASMGKAYAEQILGIENPKIGLMNVGEEEGKGNLLAQAAFELLKLNSEINFIGNIEGRDIFSQKCDIIVTDGFTGNIILKLAESIFEMAKFRKIEDEYFNRFNFEIYGGTPILGVEKPVIIGHGISKKISFKNMIAIAEKMILKNVIGTMKNTLLSLTK